LVRADVFGTAGDDGISGAASERNWLVAP